MEELTKKGTHTMFNVFLNGFLMMTCSFVSGDVARCYMPDTGNFYWVTAETLQEAEAAAGAEGGTVEYIFDPEYQW